MEIIDQKFDKLASSRIIGLLTRNSNSNNNNNKGGNAGNRGIGGEEFRENSWFGYVSLINLYANDEYYLYK